jgi:hypothetical protein
MLNWQRRHEPDQPAAYIAEVYGTICHAYKSDRSFPYGYDGLVITPDSKMHMASHLPTLGDAKSFCRTTLKRLGYRSI